MSDLYPYRDRWVAMIGDQVVGFGHTPEQAQRLAKHNRPKETFALLFVSPAVQATDAAARHPLIQIVFDIAAAAHLPVFLVGGSVRDLLLGITAHDLDFAVDGDGLRLARRVADTLGGAFVVLDRERQTGRVILQQDRPGSNRSSSPHLDFAALRGPSLEADLQDRDFAINAMALTPTPAGKLSLVDPLNGVRDLERRVLRAASPASFSSDPIRTLRAVRMCVQFGLQIDPQTRAWLCRAVPQLYQVSAERIRDEWFRILEQQHAASALSELYRLGLLAEIAPPIVSLAQVPAPYPHDGNALDHAIATVRAVEHLWEAFSGEPSSPALHALGKEPLALAPQIVHRYESAICDNRTRLALLKCAALVHRLAQPHVSAGEQESSHPHLGAEVAEKLAQSWHCSRAEVSMLRQVVLYHAQPTILAQQMPLTKRAIYRFYRDAGEHGIDAAFVALASYLAAWKKSPPTAGWDKQLETVKSLWAAYWQHRETLISPRPLLTGHDLLALGLEPGPEIGKLLARLREEQAAGQIHTRQQALELVRQWSIG